MIVYKIILCFTVVVIMAFITIITAGTYISLFSGSFCASSALFLELLYDREIALHDEEIKKN